MLTEKEKTCLKVLKRAPKTTAKAFDQLVKTNSYISKQSLHSSMRRLENKNLVRARSQFNSKLKRDVIVWELTSKGRKALDSN